LRFAGRAALQHIGNVDLLLPGQSDCLEHVVQQLAGLADKWLALEVFVLAWGFAHHHPVGLQVAHAENGLGAAPAELAGLANRDGFAQRHPVHGRDARQARGQR
jgi:hypothetical protein